MCVHREGKHCVSNCRTVCYVHTSSLPVFLTFAHPLPAHLLRTHLPLSPRNNPQPVTPTAEHAPTRSAASARTATNSYPAPAAAPYRRRRVSEERQQVLRRPLLRDCWSSSPLPTGTLPISHAECQPIAKCTTLKCTNGTGACEKCADGFRLSNDACKATSEALGGLVLTTQLEKPPALGCVHAPEDATLSNSNARTGPLLSVPKAQTRVGHQLSNLTKCACPPCKQWTAPDCAADNCATCRKRKPTTCQKCEVTYKLLKGACAKGEGQWQSRARPRPTLPVLLKLGPSK